VATAVQERRTTAIVNAQSKRRKSLTLNLIRALLGLWGGFKHWDDRDLVSGHAARSAVLVDIALAQARRQSRSYATTMLRAVGASVPQLGKVEDIYPRSGADLLDVYTRPVDQWLYNRNRGVQEAERQSQLELRLQHLVKTDVMLAQRDETAKVYSKSPKVIGRRRIIHPELSKSGFSCGLCVIAADRMYYATDLMPIHDECNCEDAPVTAGFDPGAQLNRADLDRWYEAAGGNAAEDLVNVRVAIHEHGELGPILRRDGQHFRDVDEVNQNSRRKATPFAPRTIEDQRESWSSAIERSQRAIIRLTAARDQGLDSTQLSEGGVTKTVSDYDTAIKYHRDLVSRFEARLRTA
jgi:hypothetical protein